MKIARSILAYTIAFYFLNACDSGNMETPKPPVDTKIFASNYPLAYFAQRISGDPERVYFPIIDGDPAFWDPNPDNIIKIQQCNPLFLNGATYEKWRKAVTLPERRIVDTSSPFQDQFIEIKNVVTHQHGPKGDHSHGGTSFTTWLDFDLATKQAMMIENSLAAIKLVPPDDLKKNLASLINDLHLLSDELRLLNSSTKEANPKLIASHPVYQYFARAYNLHIRSMLWEPDVFPDEEQWKLLEEILVEHPAKWMIWEEKPLQESVQRLKKLGVSSVVFNPCANTPDSGDFLSVMKQNIENLRPVFSP